MFATRSMPVVSSGTAAGTRHISQQHNRWATSGSMKSMGKACMILALFVSSMLVGTVRADGASASSNAGATAVDGGSASASASATSKGGIATASAFASTEIVEQATSLIVRAFEKVKLEATGKDCVEIVVASEVEVRAQAQAVASVYASAYGEISVEGEGEACFDADAVGDAEATAFALSVARAIVEQTFESLDGNESAEALADALAQVVAAGTAKAFADAVVSGCSTGGFGTAAQESFAESIVTPVATAFARALAGPACPEKAVSEVDAVGDSAVEEENTAESNSFTEATGTTDVNAVGGAGAESEVIVDEDKIKELIIEALPRCTRTYGPCCRIGNKRAGVCNCARATRGRLAEPQCDMVTYEMEPVHVWEDRQTGYQCKCF
eukprot:evm.model.scf_996.2 EVM.evm.TU.scf_996.2   scf_996:17102-19369(-)